ncbi:unnamed protein product [Adineta ricciae]|nr:unnamed protein product [Adineta ricciae]
MVTKVASDVADVADNDLLQVLSHNHNKYSNDNSESAEENDYDRRSTTFLRFGRQMSPSGSFLRFGRQMSPSGSFLRFGRRVNNHGSFLRFGRQLDLISQDDFDRMGHKGRFLRFG